MLNEEDNAPVREEPDGKPWPWRKKKKKSKTNDNWCTSQPMLDAIYEFNDGPPALDPCSNPNSIVGAAIEWYGPHHRFRDGTKGTCGLTMPWLVDGLVFYNPPFSNKLGWTAKAADEWDRKHCKEIIGLLPADTDTRWFQRYATRAAVRCFWRGRPTFIGDRTFPARFPIVLPYWGRRIARFKQIFGKVGWCA